MAAKKRAPARPKPAEPAKPAVEEAEEACVPRPPERGMTTEQIRRIGNRIAEHEQELKDTNTSRR